MIQVEEISLAYSGVPVFENVSFTVNSRERCSLLGRNGTGKTTLFRLLMQQETPDSGRISFSKGYRLGYLDQHIRFTAPTLIEEAVLGLREEERDQVYRAEKILFGLGFKESQLDASYNNLSGGYQLRLHLAKVLLSDPDCLLLDEPTNYLDILSLRFLAKFLQKWERELILISHDREFLDSLATHTIGIHRKKVKKLKGTSIDFFNQIAQDEELHEKARVKQEKQKQHLQSYIDRFGAKASKASQAQSKRKMLERIPSLEALKNLYDLNFHFHESPFYGRKMLEATEVSFRYLPEVPLIHNFSLMIEKGERIAIIGKNGYGKSTLLRLLNSEIKPEAGEIQTAEKLSIGYFGQTHIQRLDSSKTIEEEIAKANTLLPFSDVKRIAGQMMFGGDLAKKKIQVLSGGEKSRVLLGKILAHPCNLLLLDEPTHHLDMESIEALIDALEDFEGSIVIVTHSELILKRLKFDKIVVCHLDRQDLFIGDYEEFLEKIGWEEEGPPKKIKAPKEDPQAELKRKEKELKKKERTILELEEKMKNDELLLLELSQKRETAKIQEVLKKIEETKGRLQKLYESL